MHCSAAYSSMEAAVFNMYERNHTAIQERLEELFAVLERLGTCTQSQQTGTKTIVCLYCLACKPNSGLQEQFQCEKKTKKKKLDKQSFEIILKVLSI